MASGQKGVKSFFKPVKVLKATLTLKQLRPAVEQAAARSLAITIDRWPANHPSFLPKKGPQSMHGGCGGLWMQLHGHSAAYGVPAFNQKGVWRQATSKQKAGVWTKLTGAALDGAQEAFRTRLIAQLRINLLDSL